MSDGLIWCLKCVLGFVGFVAVRSLYLYRAIVVKVIYF